MAVEELTKKNADGTRLGQSASDKIAFFGATPVVQVDSSTTLAELTTMTGISGATVVGFSTLTQFQDTITSIVEIRDALVDLGLISAS